MPIQKPKGNPFAYLEADNGKEKKPNPRLIIPKIIKLIPMMSEKTKPLLLQSLSQINLERKRLAKTIPHVQNRTIKPTGIDVLYAAGKLLSTNIIINISENKTIRGIIAQ
ncbi:MAG: hypothetical protein HZC11_07375 [Nitrospirae bacterium]|nr:hypothetical protein [Nitrospirota bacterium]